MKGAPISRIARTLRRVVSACPAADILQPDTHHYIYITVVLLFSNKQQPATVATNYVEEESEAAAFRVVAAFRAGIATSSDGG
jgi:hypothetical protein